MCSDIGQRDHYALLINPSAQTRHLEKTEMGLAVLDRAGYETFVASPESPAEPVDHYVTPTIDNIIGLIKKIKGKIDSDDELVIYTTGHGALLDDWYGLCFGKKCYDLSKSLDAIQYGQRVVVMDQCYGGNWRDSFLDDPATLFISASSPGETAFADFPYPFWSLDITDFEDDVDWHGRFEFAVESGIYYSLPQFIPSPGFSHAGAPPFRAEVKEVANKKDVNEMLDELKPGQYAALLFSEKTEDTSAFDEQAMANGGQHLWLKTSNKKLAKAYGVETFPTVMIVDANGHTNVASEGVSAEEAIAQFHLTPEEMAMHEIAKVEAIEDPEKRFNTLGTLSKWITKKELGKAAPGIIDEMVRVAKSFKNREFRAEALHEVAINVAQAGYKKKAVSVFRKSIQTACGIKADWMRDVELRIIITSTDYSVFGEEAQAAIDISMAAAKEIDYEDELARIEEHFAKFDPACDIEVNLS